MSIEKDLSRIASAMEDILVTLDWYVKQETVRVSIPAEEFKEVAEKTAKKSAEPSEDVTPDVTDVEPEENDTPIPFNVEEVRAALGKAAKKVPTAPRDILAKFGASKLSDLAESDYEAAVKAAEGVVA